MRSMDRHHRQRWMLFNKLPRDDLGTGRWFVLHPCGCSSAGRARPRHARWWSGPRVRDSSSAPLRVCPCTPRPRDMVLVVRDVRGPWPDHVQRDTTSDGMLAFGHSRSGLPDSSCSSSWLRTPGVGIAAASQSSPVTRVQIPHATPVQEALVELTLRGRKPAASIGRRRNPSPDGLFASLTQRPECRPV